MIGHPCGSRVRVTAGTGTGQELDTRGFTRALPYLQENDETPVQFYDVLKAGLEKIEDYQGRTDDVPEYVLAMGKCQFFHQDLITDISISS